MDTLNLIWQTAPGDQTTFEFEYTTEILFKNFTQNRIFDHGSLSTVLDNSVIIYSNNSGGPGNGYEEYLDKFREKNYKVYLLQFSNEDLNHNCEYYKKATHVFRNYYDPAITLPNVTFIPLGFKSGYYNKESSIPGVEGRNIDCTFIGQPKSDRYELISEVEKLSSAFIHKTNSWNCSTAMSTEEVINVYKKTKYVPVPMGWVHPDSFRIMEALEWGCIPIIKKYNGVDYFQNIFPSHPLPVLANWTELPSVISLKDYSSLQEEVRAWYSLVREQLPQSIHNIVTTYA